MKNTQKDIDESMNYYNNKRTHQGKCAVLGHHLKDKLLGNRFGQKKFSSNLN